MCPWRATAASWTQERNRERLVHCVHSSATTWPNRHLRSRTPSHRPLTAARTPWIALCRPSPQSRLRLFCFPCAGRGSTMYRQWIGGMPPGVEVCPVQLPGRETRCGEPPYRRVQPLVADAALALQPFLDRPFAVFGHSMGGLVAFEFVRHVRRAYGLEPVLLVVSGEPAPHLAGGSPPRYNLPDEEFLAHIKSLNGTPAEALASRELMEFMLPVIKADFEVCDCYQYLSDAPLDCRVAAYGGADDPESPREQLAAWRDHAARDFVLRTFPGNHFYLDSCRESLLQALAQDLIGGTRPSC
ncbi:MAG: alpha/beta fold hydrolase [Planctomycetota bacterium]